MNGVPFQEAGLYPHHPFTGSLLLQAFSLGGFTCGLGSSLPLLLRVSPGARVSPSIFCLTTWTNPELINHLCWSHLPAVLPFSAFLAVIMILGHIMQAWCSAIKHVPTQDPPSPQLGASSSAWNLNLPFHQFSTHKCAILVAREDILGCF